MEIDYSALTVEEMEELVKNLNEQIETKRTSLIDGILREIYPYVAENSKLVKGVKNLRDTRRYTSVGGMVNARGRFFEPPACVRTGRSLSIDILYKILKAILCNFTI